MARITLDAVQCRNFDVSSRREWLLTNGLGGFAMGTVSGANSRRYHGILVASTEPPAHRTVLLANLEFEIQGDSNPIGLSCNRYPGTIHPEGYQYIEHFSVGSHDALWRFRASGMILEKRIGVTQGQNTATVEFRNAGTKGFRLSVRPLVSHKFYHANFRATDAYPNALAFPRDRTIIEHDGVPLILRHDHARRVAAAGWYYRFEHPREIDRGLDPRDDLFCPCELQYFLEPGENIRIIASTHEHAIPFTDWDADSTSSTTLAQSLRDAGAKFFVETEARTSIIAGYPWFTDWGRDTMISLPGLCLHTGRAKEAKEIISAYASQMKDGLIPNRFVERGAEPEYNTVDATLWMAHAIYAVLSHEWDAGFAQQAMSWLDAVFCHHVKGTRYGIRVDPEDGLLTQGESGVQLTWMDAKVGDWVVTPRYGKPVEINGLWINALRVMEWLTDRLDQPDARFAELAEKAESNFDRKFWKETIGHYLDTADPDDASLRPNQVIAMSLPFGPAKGDRAIRALQKVTQELLTPVGLRTLGPSEPGYRGRFKGPLPELDSAYHQGTVWPWLIGPYVTALVKLTGDIAEAKRILKSGRELLLDAGLGGISEVYDGDEPRSASGCGWQAWSVAEWLRAWVEDAGGK